jgi:hypothetical protein
MKKPKKMFDEEKLGKKSKRKTKPKNKVEITKRRVNYSWLKNKKARRCKAYIAYLSDRRKKKFREIGKKKAFFTRCILPRVLKKFPTLYKEVQEYYHEHGRSLTHEQYEELLYARFNNMYDPNLQPTGEHPLLSSTPLLRKSYLSFKKKK